jgi:drug/metabolite transporter (DMT)-like permease
MIKKSYLGLFISIASVSFAAILIKLVEIHEIYPLTVAFYRLLFTTLLILPVVIVHRKTREELLTLPLRTLGIMVLIGVILGFHFAFWFTSLTLTSVASSVILVTAHPLLVGPVSHFFLGERLSRLNVVGILLSVCGVVTLVYGNYEFSSNSIDSLIGNLLAMAGGIAAGFYILGGRKVRKTVSIGTYAFVVYLVGSLVLLCICGILRSPLGPISTRDYGIIVLLALIPGILGHTLYNWSLRHVRASLASVALLGEPIGSSLLAIVAPWIRQIPSEFTILGGSIILFGIYLTAKNKPDQ